MSIENNRGPGGPRVLDGVRVLDFSAVIAGPYCTRLMADHGADVLKIEPPEGELLRHGPPFRAGASTLFSQLNSGKRCLALDLKQPVAREIVFALLREIDVVVENFSPGVMVRLGLDYARLREHKPDLIMCSISGYGQAGPSAQRPAFGPIVQAWSGYEMVTLRYQPGLTRPLNMGVPVGDTTAALQAYGAITSALFHRERTGVGQYIDISMYDALLATMHKDFQQVLNPEMRDRIYGPIGTADGFVLLMLLTQRQFDGIAACIGDPSLKADPRFRTTADRFHHYAELIARVESWAATRTTADIVAQLDAAGVPATPYRPIDDALTDPQLLYRGMITEVVDAAGPLTVPNSPVLYSATHSAVIPWVARLGEHTDGILAELGYDAAQRDRLAAAGMIVRS
ncbi:MAG: CaiB/BaiF CoA transferase family protein [Gammaproteobacteria bacterium]